MPLRKAGIVDAPMQQAISETNSKPAQPEKFESHRAAGSADKPMTRTDWDSKDRRISRQGLFQAALQSPALMQYSPTLEGYLDLVRKTAEEGLKFVNE